MAAISLVEDTPTYKKMTVHIYGEHVVSVTVTASPLVAKKWIDKHLTNFEEHQLVAGIGVEWTHGHGADECDGVDKCVGGDGVDKGDGGDGINNGDGGDDGKNLPAETLQICINLNCLIFQLSLSPHVPKNLRTFLSNPLHKFYGLWNGSDRRKLEISNHALMMASDPIDASLYVEPWDHFGEEAMDLHNGDLNDIVEQGIGLDEIDLDLDVITKSDWRVKCLSIPQIAYATVDAYAAFYIGVGRELSLKSAAQKK